MSLKQHKLNACTKCWQAVTTWAASSYSSFRVGLSKPVGFETHNSLVYNMWGEDCNGDSLSKLREIAPYALADDCNTATRTKNNPHTTFGLKGGSTSLFSSADQLMVLKKGWSLIFPVTPSRLVGSLSNSCKRRYPVKPEVWSKGGWQWKKDGCTGNWLVINLPWIPGVRVISSLIKSSS